MVERRQISFEGFFKDVAPFTQWRDEQFKVWMKELVDEYLENEEILGGDFSGEHKYSEFVHNDKGGVQYFIPVDEVMKGLGVAPPKPPPVEWPEKEEEPIIVDKPVVKAAPKLKPAPRRRTAPKKRK